MSICRRAAAALAAVGMLLLCAVTENAPAGVLHEEMRIEGLKRTNPGYFRLLVDGCLEGQTAASFGTLDGPALEQCLMNSELFSEIRVETGEVLFVSVKERWTLIPIPYFRSQADSTSYGAFIFESNFLGRGQHLGLGATFGTRGDSHLFMHRDPSVFGSRWTSMIFYRKESADIFRYRKDTKVDGYNQAEKTVTFSPGYRFSRFLEGRLRLSYTDRGYDEADPFTRLPGDYSFWSAGMAIKLEASDFRFYFRDGHELELRLMRQFARSGGGDPALSYEIEWDWHRPLANRAVLKLNVEGRGSDSEAVTDGFQLGGRDSLRGVQERGLWARHIGGLLVDIHYPLRTGKFGTWAAGPFFSYAVYRPAGEGEKEWRDTFSYGLGLFYYLRQVAFPGIGIVAGRNDDFSGNFVSAQIGFSY